VTTTAPATSAPDVPEEPDESAPTARARRRPWSLQARLMTAIIGMVVVIVGIIGLTTSVILSSVLQENLDARISEAFRVLQVVPGSSATGVLETGGQAPGTLLVMGQLGGSVSGARVTDELSVQTLTAEQIGDVAGAVAAASANPAERAATVDIPDLGAYRIVVGGDGAFVAVLGLPLSEATNVVAQILTTVTLVTVGGLLLLSSIIALVIRVGLRPLRAVADTATRVAAMRMDSGDVSITERVPEDQTDDHTEVGQVGSALNTLLDHVDASLTARQRNEDLMRAFVADASHELRTPLASIRGYSELSLRALRQQPDSPLVAENTEQALDRIQAQSLRMTALVEDLLLLARLDEGQELVYGSVDLTRLAIEAVGDARPAGPDHRWLLDVDDEPVLLAGDTARLHQVVANLLANARTHTPAGTSVTVTVHRDRTDAVLSVHDDGPGIDPAVAEKLFERFARGDRSRDRRTGGTGLGLSIARAIVEAHGGRISVQSAPGDTTFEVRLPARPADPA
jgi:two-component system, OmpR family, sensor kinase